MSGEFQSFSIIVEQASYLTHHQKERPFHRQPQANQRRPRAYSANQNYRNAN
jgi:hypothetical protein